MKSSNVCREDFDAGPTSIHYLETNLYIGNLSAALDTKTLEKYGINRILTVDTCPLPRDIIFLPEMQTKFIQVTDLPYEDLLSSFDETYNFIKDGQLGGSVLVHCYFGVSRSATVVIAFFMKKYELTFETALSRLKKSRNLISPNRGFEHQLRLYETLKYKIDKNNLQYKMFRLRVTANKVFKARIVPQDCMNVIKPDPSIERVNPESKVYRCRKCRRIVASVNNILPHVKGEKASWKNIKWSSDYNSLNVCSEMYFIEPLSWIESVTNTIEGKILCPKCKSKLGSFNWLMGSQCGCGSKVAPSFYLIPSKVDFSHIVQNIQITI